MDCSLIVVIAFRDWKRHEQCQRSTTNRQNLVTARFSRVEEGRSPQCKRRDNDSCRLSIGIAKRTGAVGNPASNAALWMQSLLLDYVLALYTRSQATSDAETLQQSRQALGRWKLLRRWGLKLGLCRDYHNGSMTVAMTGKDRCMQADSRGRNHHLESDWFLR